MKTELQTLRDYRALLKARIECGCLMSATPEPCPTHGPRDTADIMLVNYIFMAEHIRHYNKPVTLPKTPSSHTMNTNEQTELGKLAFFTYWGDVPTSDAWEQAPPQTRDKWTQAASAVEQAVLERLPGEWGLLSSDAIVQRGDEKRIYGAGVPYWSALSSAGWKVGSDCIRRRFRRTEAKAEPEWKPKGMKGERVSASSCFGRIEDFSVPMQKTGIRWDNGNLTYLKNEEYTVVQESPFLTPEELRAMLGGREPHRLDGWRREWLTDGWRPFLKGEPYDMQHDEVWDYSERWASVYNPQYDFKQHAQFMRTCRSLPPTTEQKPEGVSRLASLREAWAARRAFVPASSESPPQGTDVPPSWWSQFSREELETVAEGYGNHIVELDAALSRITKERDEARAINVQTLRDSQEQHARAEQSEKKLAEAERSRRFEKEAFMRQSQDMERLRQKLQKVEASVPRWVPTSKRLPTKDDANEKGKVWVADIDGVESSSTFIECVHSDGWDFWMTPIPAPLPTPTEEKDDAFMKWWRTEAELALRSTKGVTMDVARIIFQAASNSPLTKEAK